jgi:hypothetical protein
MPCLPPSARYACGAAPPGGPPRDEREPIGLAPLCLPSAAYARDLPKAVAAFRAEHKADLWWSMPTAVIATATFVHGRERSDATNGPHHAVKPGVESIPLAWKSCSAAWVLRPTACTTMGHRHLRAHEHGADTRPQPRANPELLQM